MKNIRQNTILKIIETNDVSTQSEIVKLLEKSGFNATQATVSRDIKELHLVRALSSEGKYFYTRADKKYQLLSDRSIRLFSEAYVSCEISEGILVVKTVSGSAALIAETIDNIKNPQIVGTIAGNDIVLVLVSNKDYVLNVKEFIDNIIR